MRLAAAEVGLELDDRITPLPCQSSHPANEQSPKAFGEKCASEEFSWIAVLVGALTKMNLPKVGGELRLLVAAARNVPVRTHHFAPRFQSAGNLAFDRGPGALAPFGTRMFLENEPPQLHLHPVNFVRLRCGDSRQQPRDGVERAIGVIAAEGAVTRTEFGRTKIGSPSSGSGRGSSPPRPERFVSEDAKRAAGSEMALDVERVVDGGVNGQETLS